MDKAKYQESEHVTLRRGYWGTKCESFPWHFGLLLAARDVQTGNGEPEVSKRRG